MIKEYERGATTVLNAYLERRDRPLHLGARRISLAGGGLRRRTRSIMQSSGGVTSAEKAKGHAVRLSRLGPGRRACSARPRSARLSVSPTSSPPTSAARASTSGSSSTVSRSSTAAPVFDKYHTVLPVTDVASIGAGGGSIAWIEPATGQLKVGPQSAGADPGPACYGNGGAEPTVTDANVVLGRIDPDYFLGGERPLDRDCRRARDRVTARAPLGSRLVEAAMGIVEILDARMADLVRRETIGRGYDPREFALSPSAAPARCTSAPTASMSAQGRSSCRRTASVFSAFGIAGADLVTVQQAERPDDRAVRSGAAQRESTRSSGLRRSPTSRVDGIAREDVTLRAEIEMRYRGQVHEVRVPVPSQTLTESQLEEIMSEFENRYTRRYGKGTAHDEAGIEARTYVVRGVGRLGTPSLQVQPLGPADPSEARIGERPVYFRQRGGHVPTAIYRWEDLKPGHLLEGPAVVEAVTTSTVVHPGQRARVDGLQNVLLETA